MTPAGPRRRVLCPGRLEVLPVPGVPDIGPRDDLADIVLGALEAATVGLAPWDVVVVTQKVVSKAEGAVVELDSVRPSPRAVELAHRTGLDPRVVEVVLAESVEVVRAAPRLLLCATRHGFVTANAGVDHSNVGEGRLSLLPRAPDASAAGLRARWLPAAGGGPLGVIVADSFGRPFRVGTCNVAVGVAGMPAVTDHVGDDDLYGVALRSTVLASVDEVAAAADLVMGKLRRVPVAIVRGLRWEGPDEGVRPLLRDPASDVFRSGDHPR